MSARFSSLSSLLLISILYGTNPLSVRAQVAPSAFKSSLSLSAGGMTSAFVFHDVGDIRDRTGGVGGYVDLTVRHGVGVEAAGRWQRFYVWQGIHRDNYLIGPRMQFRPFCRTRPYLKALGGFTDIGFGAYGEAGASERLRLAEALISDWPAGSTFEFSMRNTSLRNGQHLLDRTRCRTESASGLPIAFSRGLNPRLPT